MQQNDTDRAAELQKILDNYKRIDRLMGRGPISKPVVIPRPQPKLPAPLQRLPNSKAACPVASQELFEKTYRHVGKFPPEVEKEIMDQNKALRNGKDLINRPLSDSEILQLFSPIPAEVFRHDRIAIAHLRDKIDRFIFDRHGFTLRALSFSKNWFSPWMSQARAEAYHIFMLLTGFGPTAVGDAFATDHTSVIYGTERYKSMQKAGVWWTTGHFKGWKLPKRDRKEYKQAAPRKLTVRETIHRTPNAEKQARFRARRKARREEQKLAATIAAE